MKVAFHFDAHHASLRDSSYGYAVQERVIALLLEHRTASVSSKIFGGDLLLHQLAYESEEIEGGGRAHRFNPDKYRRICQMWIQPGHAIWSALLFERLQEALAGVISTVCFETLPASIAEYIHSRLLKTLPSYLGALEVDDASLVHWELYSNSIIPIYRLMGKRLTVFWDGISEGSKDEGLLQSISALELAGKVEFESLNGQGTIFDQYHDFDHARRVAEWKRRFGSLLAFLAEDVVHRLGDAAPDLGDKLWSALMTFEAAETNEQLAQVTASCRRIIEYISDQLFPPRNEVEGRHKLGAKHYRNRLLAFADVQRKSDTNIDLVAISMQSLGEQLEALANLANKGVHAEVYRAETRRCLLRTVLLLDDIIGLRPGSFPIVTKLNFDDFISDG